MKSSSITTTKVILELTKEEAEWLKGVVKNPIGGGEHEDEPESHRSMRQRFWDALAKEGI